VVAVVVAGIPQLWLRRRRQRRRRRRGVYNDPADAHGDRGVCGLARKAGVVERVPNPEFEAAIGRVGEVKEEEEEEEKRVERKGEREVTCSRTACERRRHPSRTATSGCHTSWTYFRRCL